MLEVTDAAIDVWGAGRVGMHLAPRGDSHDMGDDNLARNLQPTWLANWASAASRSSARARSAGDDSLGPQLKEAFGGAVHRQRKLHQGQRQAWLASGKADAVAFGVPFIANPDLPARLKADAPLNDARPERSTPRARWATSTTRRCKRHPLKRKSPDSKELGLFFCGCELALGVISYFLRWNGNVPKQEWDRADFHRVFNPHNA